MRLKSQGIYTHTYTYITGTWRERKREADRERGKVNIICCASHIVYSTESGEIGIRVCFCSDMDEEPQSTDQSTDRRRVEGGVMRGGEEKREQGEGEH